MDLVRSINESFDRLSGILEEAKISPEDKHDSDIIRGIYAKLDQPGRKKFSDEEIDVMKKYDLDFSREYWTGKRDNRGLVTKDNAYLTYNPNYKNNDKVNYADKARKAPERHQDSKYKRNPTRWSPENHSVFSPKQSWSRWQDDQEMKLDYRDKYHDLYDKSADINTTRAWLDSDKKDLSRLQKQVADLENNVNARQQHYDQQKAEWKKMLADRRAKRDESLIESYASRFSRSQLMDLIDEFYGRSDSHDGAIWQGLGIEDILLQHGANPNDDDPDEGFYNTMSNDQLREVFDIIRAVLRNRANYYASDSRGMDLLDKFGVIQSWDYDD